MRGDRVTASQSVVGKIIADSACLDQSYAGSIVAERAELQQSATLTLQTDAAGLSHSAAGVVRAGQVQLDRSPVGAVVGGTVSGPEIRCGILRAERVEGNVSCLLDRWWVAAIGGAAIGVGFALTEFLLRARRRG